MSKFNTLINESPIPVLVDFYADWCQPCKVLGPIIQEVAGKLDGKVKVIKVNVDKNPQASATYQVRGIPALILFHQGQILWRHAGVLSEQAIISAIQPYCK